MWAYLLDRLDILTENRKMNDAGIRFSSSNEYTPVQTSVPLYTIVVAFAFFVVGSITN